VQACPNNALELVQITESHINIDRNICNISGDCIRICPTGALQFTGSVAIVSDIINEIEKDTLYYQVSGGGVTLTGGEPLYQPDFTKEILKECRKRNIHTAVETCLFCEREIIEGISDFVDLFIVDLKIFDRAQHIRYTGKSNDIIRENIRYLAESGKNILVRIPMITGITDTEENKNECKKFVHDIDSRIPVEYIDYNPLAENNYKRLGIPFLIK
jgi:pyruvate formate lyase activating enzyme